jgi:putative transposase
MAHPPRIPVWLPLECDVVYFVTFCVAHRRPVLANPKTFEAIAAAMARLTGWWVYAAVVMPDHVHALASPRDREAPVGNLSGAIKRWTRQQLQATWQWQPGSFDRLLRTEETAQAKWAYMRENPVRAKLVTAWEAWPYSIGFREPPG